MNLEIDNWQIEKSFDRIAIELLNKKVLIVNEIIFRFTEIEFYYFHHEYHRDEYTHKHLRRAGEWRFHNQGIDITLNGNEESDGGILIRGVFVDSEYINGPKNSLKKIFEAFGDITKQTSIVLKDYNMIEKKIIKTFRHIPNKEVHFDFHKKHYRYLIDLTELKISDAIKKEIEINCSFLK